MKLKTNFKAKYIISTALMIENPVRSPMVPPIADNISANLAALSFLTLSNVGVSKTILIYFKVWSTSYSKETINFEMISLHLPFNLDGKSNDPL